MDALDGNTIAGILYQVFGGEMTTAQAECGGCRMRGPLAECTVYLGGPGVVVRCRRCHSIGIVLAEIRGMTCVDVRGLTDLESPAGRW